MPKLPTRQFPSITPFHHALIAIGTLAALTFTAHAQPTSPPPTPTSGALSDKIITLPSPILLNNSPTRIDSINLNIFLPEGSTIETTSFGSNSTMGVGLPDQLGIMTIKEQKTSDPDLTIAQISENIIGQLTRFANSKTGKLIAHEPNLVIKPHTGERFYVRLPGLNGDPDTIRGMTIFQSAPRKFVIFDFTCLESNFERARAYYETSVGSMDLGNPTRSDLRRSAAIKSMLTFIDLRTIEDYQDAMTSKKDRWERLYLPSTTGDEMDATEFGYRKVRSWGGFKGELSDKPKSSWNNEDQKLGYFVQIDAMALEEHIRVDTRATFYMSEDTKEESWTIKMSLKRNGVQQTSTITGARSGTSMAVMLDQSDAPTSKTHPLIQGEGYLSQVQTYLIGSMLADHAFPGEYASYAYNSSIGAIALRWDIVDHPEATPDLTRITTKVSNNTPPNVSTYDSKGNLMRVQLANGRIWEPIELSRLIKLWTKKGLPLE